MDYYNNNNKSNGHVWACVSGFFFVATVEVYDGVFLLGRVLRSCMDDWLEREGGASAVIIMTDTD